VTVVGEQKILGLEIAVDDTHVVEILEAQSYLGNVELGARLGELLLLLKMREQLTTIDKVCLHQKHKPSGLLFGKMYP
jgi:hypothetical protein